jgi:hypothetical protein
MANHPGPVSTPPEKTTDGLPGLSSGKRRMRVRSWMRSKLIQSWIQSLGILIAAGWGVYTFIYTDVLVPSWQPANLTLEATITPVEGRRAGPDGMEAMLDAKATNSSSRTVYLLANYWILSAMNRQFKGATGSRDERRLIDSGHQVLRQSQLSHFERDVTSEPEPNFLAIGRLFDDDVIQPGESINRSILVRIPPGTNALELRALVPLLTRKPDATSLNERKLFNGHHLEWGLADPLIPSPMLCSPPTESTRNNNCRWEDIDAISKELDAFDGKNATITIRKQIGLPE